MADDRKGLINRREMVGGLLLAAAGAKVAKGQQPCAPTSSTSGFKGTVGNFAEDLRALGFARNLPQWLDRNRHAQDGHVVR